MKNLINVDKEVIELSERGIQIWITPLGGVRITQRIQLSDIYAVMKLSDREQVYATADTMYTSDLLKSIEHKQWKEVTDAVICRESDLKERKISDDESNN